MKTYCIGKRGEALCWNMMEQEGGESLLLAGRGVAGKQFVFAPSDEVIFKEKTYWDNSALKEWLNTDFKKACFSREEQSCIKEITIPTIEQIIKWFPEREQRKCMPLRAAVEEGVCVFEEDGGTCAYWLQDTGRRRGLSASLVRADGGIYQSAYMAADNIAVRPVLVLQEDEKWG